LLLLAACATPPGGDAVFRNAGAPIWSAAAFAPSGIAGRWQQVAAYQTAASGSCRGGAVAFEPVAGGLMAEGSLCLNGSVRKISGLARPAGPGRLALAGEEDWWILWVDSGYRTLAVGTPSGAFGFVLDRGTAAPDRLTAAREVFDFNGYTASAFRAF
jgi:apolipoprotein D and lipocalin family protein